MKPRFFICCFAACAAVLALNAAAAEYTDDMGSAKSSDFKSYGNLSVQSYKSPQSLPDPSALTFSNASKPEGSAVYLASGVETVSAAIYTQVGTLVTRQPGNGAYMLGIFQQNVAEIITNGPLQALYCPQTGGIYTEAGGLKQAAIDMTNYWFVPVISPPKGEIIGYGVNIYYSVDGSRFVRVPMTGFSYSYNLSVPYFYEEYLAAVPQSANMIKVEINDAYTVPLAAGGSLKKESRYMTALASVTLYGRNLSLGISEPADTSPEISQSFPGAGVPNYGSAEAEEYVEQKTEKTENDEGGAGEKEQKYFGAAQTEEASGPESSSKFSGTITSSSKERSSSSQKTQQSSRKDSGAKESSAPATEESGYPDEPVIYEVSGNQKDSGFNGVVVVYIAGVSAAILLAATLPPKK